MDSEYYGPTRDAVEKLNEELSLPACGREQDWELELCDPERISEFTSALRDSRWNIEERSALALLCMFSFDEAFTAGLNVEKEAAQLRDAIAAFPPVKNRMRFYWGRHEDMPHVVSLLD